MGVVVRDGRPEDAAAVRRFGETHVRAHYAPLIGEDAADAQVRDWWSEAYLGDVLARGLVVVAEDGGTLVGVGQRGRSGPDHVIYKLYVDPGHRGAGLGPRLLDALVDRLPDDADRVLVEHVAANERAGAFYEREGFTVDRIEPSASGRPELAQVWRVRSVRPGR